MRYFNKVYFLTGIHPKINIPSLNLLVQWKRTDSTKSIPVSSVTSIFTSWFNTCYLYLETKISISILSSTWEYEGPDSFLMTSSFQRHSGKKLQKKSTVRFLQLAQCQRGRWQQDKSDILSPVFSSQMSTLSVLIPLCNIHYFFVCSMFSAAQEDIQSSKPRYRVQKKMELLFVTLRYDLLPTYLKQFPS